MPVNAPEDPPAYTAFAVPASHELSERGEQLGVEVPPVAAVDLTWDLSGFLERIDDGQERESSEVPVSRTDAADSVLAHQHCRVEVVEHVASQFGELRDGPCQDRNVTRGGDQQVEAR